MLPNNQEDIRDIESGETYYVVARPEDGHPVMRGCFRAVWRSRRLAKMAALGLVADGKLEKGFRILKQVKD